MVKCIEEIGAELNPASTLTTESEVLENREVQIIDAWQLQRIASSVGENTVARLDVLGVRVGRHVTYNFCALHKLALVIKAS